MAKGNGGASQKLLLVVLLALIGGAGAWNYQRNLKADEAEPRPYRSYADADLGVLLEAYRQELDTDLRRYEAATGAKLTITGGRLLGDQIEEFERVQRISRATRALGARIAEHQASVDQLDAEKQKRIEESRVLQLFLKRLFVYRG